MNKRTSEQVENILDSCAQDEEKILEMLKEVKKQMREVSTERSPYKAGKDYGSWMRFSREQ